MKIVTLVPVGGPAEGFDEGSGEIICVQREASIVVISHEW